MTPPVISAWSAVSPFGLGAKEFAAGVGQRRSAISATEPGPDAIPDERSAPVPGFTAADVLGRKGTRSMDRLSALAVAAVGQLLADERYRAAATGEGAGLVLGTTAGSAKSMMDITRDTLTRAMPFHIDTARIPNAIMNSAAAQCAIWYGLAGPNVTVAGGRVAGLFALRYAKRLLAAGRARSVICGGAEELTAERAWLEYHGRGGVPPVVPLGEGCAALLVQPGGAGAGPGADPDAGPGTGAPPLAEIAAVELGVFGPGGLAAAMGECVDRALRRAKLTWPDLALVSAAGLPGEPDGVRERLAGQHPVWLPGDELWGDAGAASASFQLAAVLATAGPGVAGRAALVTSADADGVCGCALLRLLDAEASGSAGA